MESPKLLKSLIVLLIFINLGIILFIWLDKPPKDGDEIKTYFIKELKLNNIQQKEYSDLIDEQRKQRSVLQKQRDKASDIFYGLLNDPTADSMKIQESCSIVMLVKEKEELLLFYHFKKIRDLCDNKQKYQFDLIIKEALKKFGHDGKKRKK